jgi:hypothetical protein
MAANCMPNILHLSDLHFGDDKDATARGLRTESLDLLVKELKNLDAAWKPDILAISGDLTWQGRASGYTELTKWLRQKLFPATGLTAPDCIVCPGNHDIDREAAEYLERRTSDPNRADELLRPEGLAKGFAPPFAVFAKFAKNLRIPAPTLQGKPNHLAGVRDLKGIRFVCANSAWFCRDSRTDRSQLWLGQHLIRTVMGGIHEDAYDSSPITVTLLHHPEGWLADAECNSYNDRSPSFVYLARRSHLILSGHTHGRIVECSRPYDRARLVLSGAAYDNHQYRNNFSILKIDLHARTVTRRPWEMDPSGPRWEAIPEQHYSLKVEKLRRGQANTAKYIAWLRDKTRSIELNQLNVASQEVPPPSIDTLFIRLKTFESSKGPIELEEALRADRRLVIEGKPGGGKTTFVRWLGWQLCRPEGPPPELQWLAGFPIWVRISELDSYMASAAIDPSCITRFLASQPWNLSEDFFAAKLGEETTVLMLDGLDEAATGQRRVAMVKMILAAASQFGCRIVVTTRPGVHEGRATLAGFGLAMIDELDEPGIAGFLMQWCRWLKRGDETAAQAYYKDLHPAVSVPGIRYLARNPLMLTSLAVLHFRRNRLPQQRVKLYEQILDWLAEQTVDKHKEYNKDSLLERLGVLALAMQEWKGGLKLKIGIDDGASILTPEDGSLAPMRNFLEKAQVDSGIVTLRGKELVFWHRGFQEYLAARRLAGLTDATLALTAREMLYTEPGREVLALVAARMAEGGKERLRLLFLDLIGHAIHNERLEGKVHAVGVLGNMLADVEPFEFELLDPAKTKYNELLNCVKVIFEKGKAKSVGAKTRGAAAEVLDQASQERLLTPDMPMYWIPIGGGKFKIGRYPVTVFEYGKYLESTGADAPKDWEEQRKHPGRPVVNVTWHQAIAYCKELHCDLPTDEQWEFAARGDEGRKYPWGSEEPDKHSEPFRGVVGDVTPVGLFPDGDTPEGVSDMAGSVWEWTGSGEEGLKSLRGASGESGASYLRAANRDRDGPVFRLSYLGFRCVREVILVLSRVLCKWFLGLISFRLHWLHLSGG